MYTDNARSIDSTRIYYYRGTPLYDQTSIKFIYNFIGYDDRIESSRPRIKRAFRLYKNNTSSLLRSYDPYDASSGNVVRARFRVLERRVR